MNNITLMTQYLVLYLSFAKKLTSYSKRWESQINQQPSISSYHTTTNAQIQIIKAPESHANQIKILCNAIQGVIDEYTKQVNEMYPRHRFSTTHKHCRAEEMKRLFKTARSSLQNTLDELEELNKKKKRASDALSTAEKEHENLNHDSTTPEKKLTQAHEKVIQRRQELQLIENNIVSAEVSRNAREKHYREEATKIFEQCQKLEKPRLDQIKQTLINFCQAVSSSEYSNNLETIYKQVIDNITAQQNSMNDLHHWAETNGITKTDLSTTNETDSNDDNDSGVLSTTESTTINQTNNE
jgi:chromosome segregation ATPase